MRTRPFAFKQLPAHAQCIRSVTWTAKALALVLLSPNTALLHLFPSTGVGQYGCRGHKASRGMREETLLI